MRRIRDRQRRTPPVLRAPVKREVSIPEGFNTEDTPHRKLRLGGDRLGTYSGRVFLTGHKGYLGGHVLNDLSKDYIVTGYDLKAGQDILDYPKLVKDMKDSEVVVHSAGIPHPNAKYQLGDYIQANVMGTWNVLKAAVENRVGRFIYLSSGGIYGWDTVGKYTPLYFPIDETQPPASVTGNYTGKLSGYAQSKFLAEQLVMLYGTNGCFQTVALRIAPAVAKANFFRVGKEEHRTKTFWANAEPESVARMVRLVIETDLESNFEMFNVAEKDTHPDIDLNKYLQEYYPDVPVRDWQAPQSLISTKKAQEMLGY